MTTKQGKFCLQLLFFIVFELTLSLGHLSKNFLILNSESQLLQLSNALCLKTLPQSALNSVGTIKFFFYSDSYSNSALLQFLENRFFLPYTVN